MWTLIEDGGTIRMKPEALRAMGDEQFTWAHLLYGKLGDLKVGIFYFPSRFAAPIDSAVIGALRTFGQNSGATTSVNIWDTRDSEFDHALGLFALKTVPAVVLVTGLQVEGMQPRQPDKTSLYSITIDDPAVLSDLARFQAAINSAHEVLTRSDPKEISSYIRSQKSVAIVAAIGKLAAHIRDEILRWKPKFGLPGGIFVQVG